VEPAIGPLKADHGISRCPLKGSAGDAIHALLCAGGFNIAWLLRAIVRKGLKGLFARLLLLRLRLWLAQSALPAAAPPIPALAGVR
jgi:IS5 family transposase